MFIFDEDDLKMLLPILMLLSLLMCWPVQAPSQQLPNKNLTPGVVNKEIVADTSGKHVLIDGVEYNICAKGFTTKPFRHTSEALKKEVCKEYGSPKDCPDPKKGEVDHLIPLVAGGKDVLENLWWQLAPEYHEKDRKVEDKLKPLICKGKISLADAQTCISTNWVACEARIKELDNGLR